MASSLPCRKRFAGSLALLAAVIIIVYAAVSAAEIEDVFTVADIRVDEVAEGGAADARTIALAKGERRAFSELMRRLTVRGDHNRLPQLGSEAISGLVQDLSIANEKNSRVRYLADLTYRFKPGAVHPNRL